MLVTGLYLQAYQYEFLSLSVGVLTQQLFYSQVTGVGAHITIQYIPTLAVLSLWLRHCRKAARCQFSCRWKQQVVSRLRVRQRGQVYCRRSSDGRIGVSCRRSSRKSIQYCRQGSKVLVSYRQSSQSLIRLLQAGAVESLFRQQYSTSGGSDSN